MTAWGTFAGLTGVVLLSLLALARASQGTVRDAGERPDALARDSAGSDRHRGPVDDERDDVDRESVAPGAASRDAAAHDTHDVYGGRDLYDAHDATGGDGDAGDGGSFGHPPDGPATRAGVRAERDRRDREPSGGAEVDPITGVSLSRPRISTAALLVNVALSQGIFGVALVLGAWYTQVPLAALGVALDSALSTGLPAVGVGLALGVALYAANAVGAASAASFGFEHDETLRDLLTPSGPLGWVVLLGFVLPVIAGFEEFLFRAALVGALSTGFGVSPWLLAVVSSAAFAVGHGAQGRAGVVVTGLLGFVLAGAFVLTNSLLAVVLAHYVVNALEFVVSGWLGVEWGSG